MSLNLKSLFKHRQKADVVSPEETQYAAVINNHYYWYKSKKEMIDSIEQFSQNNVIFSLTMYRMDIFNLLK